jgi:ArsR family transcriptional regulator, lead/cadmium/zinc/bismuth-responsive transcriptional repressor
VAQSAKAIDQTAVKAARRAVPDAEILDLVVRAFRALGDETRAKLLYALMSRPLCVRDLALVAGVSESAASHQLRVLKLRRLVRAERRAGNQIEYQLDDSHLAALFREAEFHADHVLRGRPDHPYPKKKG